MQLQVPSVYLHIQNSCGLFALNSTLKEMPKAQGSNQCDSTRFWNFGNIVKNLINPFGLRIVGSSGEWY